MKRIVTPYTVTKETLAAGESLVVTENIIKTNKRMTFTADIPALGEGKLILGHGYMATNASWVEITSSEVSGHSFYHYANPPMSNLNREQLLHGIEKIEGFVTVNIDYKTAAKGADVVIMSAGGMYKCFLPGWFGADGEVFARFEGIDAKNCKLIWTSDDFAKPIWLVGDSYTGIGHDARWPYYLHRDGYLNTLIFGFPGMGSRRGVDELVKCIDKGEPEFIVWCMGMNNGDKTDSEVDSAYLAATEEFLALCKARGITPILSTIPNTPKVNNRAKNAWVRKSGYRYIDFARAVGSDDCISWYEGMISADEVHPASRGAAALYSQVLIDFPEIMQKI